MSRETIACLFDVGQPLGSSGHLVDEPGAKKTRCGLKANDVPHGWVRWAQAHIDGYGASFCPQCTDGVDLAAVDVRLEAGNDSDVYLDAVDRSMHPELDL